MLAMGSIFSDIGSGIKSVASDVENYATPWGLIKNVGAPAVAGAFTVTSQAIATVPAIVRPAQAAPPPALSPAGIQALLQGQPVAGGSSNALLYGGLAVAALLLVVAIASKRKVAPALPAPHQVAG